MLFKAKFKNGKNFHELVDTIGAFVNEGNFIADHQGLRFMGMEANRVAMAVLNMPTSAFAEFECDGSILMGVDFGQLKKITARIQPKESLLLSVEDKGELIMKAIPEKKTPRTYRYRLIDVATEDDLKPPRLPFDVVAKFPAFVLDGIIQDVNSITSSEDSQLVKVATTSVNAQIGEKGHLNFTAESTYGSTDIPVTLDGDLISLIIKNDEKIEDLVGLKYLLNLTKACAMTDILTFSYSDKFPIRIDFALPLGGELTYFIAPRIEE